VRTCVVFASTSGSTRVVARLIAEANGGADLFDLARCDEWLPGFHGDHDITFIGTPTYGTGDWHYRWERHGRDIASRLDHRRPVALFTLGDARGHADSFAGGLRRLRELCGEFGLPCVGGTDPHRFAFRQSPALEAGRFPGLVLEYRREHRAAPDIISRWVGAVCDSDRVERMVLPA
jgi:flavodoxin